MDGGGELGGTELVPPLGDGLALVRDGLGEATRPVHVVPLRAKEVGTGFVSLHLPVNLIEVDPLVTSTRLAAV